jgi:ribosomal protein L7/L12
MRILITKSELNQFAKDHLDQIVSMYRTHHNLPVNAPIIIEEDKQSSSDDMMRLRRFMDRIYVQNDGSKSKIVLIKNLRELTGMGLKDAKDLSEVLIPLFDKDEFSAKDHEILNKFLDKYGEQVKSYFWVGVSR